MPTGGEHHQVVVVRVAVRNGPANGLLIELLEVSRDREGDRLLGSATNAVDACQVLETWLRSLPTAHDSTGPATAGRTE